MEVNRSRNNKVKCAVLDTNVLMYVFLYKIDVFSQLKEYGIDKFIIPVQVFEELKTLEKSKGSEKRAAKFALSLIRLNCEIVEVDANGADNALMKIAKECGCYLVTNDKTLRKKARNNKIAVGYIRELKKLEIEEF
ncbi:ribonuclease VapC [Archaeoglobales archaeon]|nr:MAG: ribonuclease VapC [Archaeoglobales archaeon]